MARPSQALQAEVRRRAGRRCEYCLFPEAAAELPFHVDHIIAQKHRGQTESANLAWACFQCNIAKGTDVASYDAETRELAPLYNPRKQHWSDHFEMINATIVGKTAAGRVTVRLLQMNEPEQREIRRLLIAAGEW